MAESAKPQPEITPKLLQTYVDEGLIKVGRDPVHKNLAIYNYTDKAQFKKKWDHVTLSCRGLVVDTSTPQGKIIARPMTKFFDYSNKRHKAADSDPFSILEKLDGSLCIFFWYKNEWMMCTRGSFMSEESKLGMQIAIEKKLWQKCDKRKTYCFEVIHPTKRVLVDYGSRKDLVLLAVIDTETGFDCPNKDLPGIASKLGVSVVQSFDSTDGFDGLSPEQLRNLERYNEEGFVIRFGTTGERCKIKFDSYLKLTRVKNHGGLEHILDALSLKDSKEAEKRLSHLPDEFYDEVKKVADAYKAEKLKNELEFDRLVEQHKGKELKSLPAEVKKQGLLMRYLRLLSENVADQALLEECKEGYTVTNTKAIVRKTFEGRPEYSNDSRKKKKKKNNKKF